MVSHKTLKTICVSAVLAIATLQGSAQGNPLNSLGTPTKYGNQQFGTSPSMTVFNGYIYIAYMSNGGDDTLYITNSSNNYASATHFTNIKMRSATAPAIATYNGYLWLAWVNGSTNIVNLAYSTNGTTFSSPVEVLYGSDYVTATSQPSLASFNGSLWIAAVGPNSDSSTSVLYVESTTNGSSFQTGEQCYVEDYTDPTVSGAGIGMAEFNSELYLAYRRQSNTVGMCIITTAGGSSIYTTSLTDDDAGIAAATYNGALYLAYKNTSNNNLIMAETTNGITFSTYQYTNMQINGDQNIAPSTTVLGDYFYLAQTANNSAHYMYLAVN